MKRLAFGVLWFLVFWFSTLIIGVVIVAFFAGYNIEASTLADSISKGQSAGEVASAEFSETYGNIILLGALVLSIGGTILGVLPGTKPREKDGE